MADAAILKTDFNGHNSDAIFDLETKTDVAGTVITSNLPREFTYRKIQDSGGRNFQNSLERP